MSESFSRYDLIEQKFVLIFEWASEHPEFDTDFVDNVYNQFENKGDISDRQLSSLDRIIEKWGME